MNRFRWIEVTVTIALILLPLAAETKQKKPTLKPYCHCKCRFETDGGVPMLPVEHDVRIQTDDCGDLASKRCAVEGQEGDGYLKECSSEPIYETEKLVISGDLEILPVDPGKSGGGSSREFYDQVKRHFGTMHYQRAVVPDQCRIASDLKLYTGEGTAQIRGEKLDYRWAAISDGGDNISDYFFGTSNLDSDGVVEISKTEAWARLAVCKQSPEGSAAWQDCLVRLKADIIDGCAAQTMGTEECRTNCWFNVCRWCGTDCQ